MFKLTWLSIFFMKIEFINKRLKIVSYLLKSSFFIILNFFFPPGNMRQIFSKIQKWVGSKILLLYCIVASVTQGNSINIHTEVARIQNLELPNVIWLILILMTLFQWWEAFLNNLRFIHCLNFPLHPICKTFHAKMKTPMAD